MTTCNQEKINHSITNQSMLSSWVVALAPASSHVHLKLQQAFALFGLQMEWRSHLNEAKTPASIFTNWLMRLPNRAWWKIGRGGGDPPSGPAFFDQCRPLRASQGLVFMHLHGSQSAHAFWRRSYISLKAQQRAEASLLLTFGILDGACCLCDSFTCIFIPAIWPRHNQADPREEVHYPASSAWSGQTREDSPARGVEVG